MSTWKTAPTPGDMAICRTCPSRRDDDRRDYRCARTYHQPFMPPLTELRNGKGWCAFWPDRFAGADPNQLSLLDEPGPEVPLECAAK